MYLLVVDGILQEFSGTGKRKQQARHNAAKEALLAFGQQPSEVPAEEDNNHMVSVTPQSAEITSQSEE